jgi:hypothetical protein
MWRAQHEGPGGMRGSAEFGAWVDAANWLAAMLRVIHPVVGFKPACFALAAAQVGSPFDITVGGHQFWIARADAPPALPPQRDLFQAAAG